MSDRFGLVTRSPSQKGARYGPSPRRKKTPHGRAGKLDFSIDRVSPSTSMDPPYTVTRNRTSHSLSTGILPRVSRWCSAAAPVMLLRKGNDVTVNRGVTFDVFTDSNHTVTRAGVRSSASPAPSDSSARVVIASPVPGADIEVDGMFVGNTPTTVQLVSGHHSVVVKQGAKAWQRTLQVNDSSEVTLKAVLQ